MLPPALPIAQQLAVRCRLQLPQPLASAAASPPRLPQQTQVVKQRDVRCWVPEGRLTSLGVDGTVATWDGSLRLCRKVGWGCQGVQGASTKGGRLQRHLSGQAPIPLAPSTPLHNKSTTLQVVLEGAKELVCFATDAHLVAAGSRTQHTIAHIHTQVVLEGAKELVCLATDAHLVAAGSRCHLHLLDMRARCTGVGLVPMTDHGVRSLSIEGHLLSAGTGDAALVFYDLRYLRKGRGARLRDLGTQVRVCV